MNETENLLFPLIEAPINLNTAHSSKDSSFLPDTKNEVIEILVPPNHSQSMGNFLRESSKGSVYHPFHVPPDINLAKSHGLARRVCLPPNQRTPIFDLCPCCGLPIKNQQYPICVDTNDFVNMGSCFPGYFDFIKFCAVLILMLFLTSGIFLLLAQDVFGGVCEEIFNNNSLVCGLSFLDLLRDDKTNMKIIRILCILLLINVFVMIFVTEAFAIKNHLKLKKLDNKKIAINDFTVFIGNLPIDTDPNHLIDFVVSKFSKEVKIENIYYIFDFTEYERLYEMKKKYIKEKPKNLNEGGGKMTEDDPDKALKDFENALLGKDYSKMMFTGHALITFSLVKDAKDLIKMWEYSTWEKIKVFFTRGMRNKPRSLQRFLYRGEFIKMRKAPLPSDLIWTHQKPGDEKWKPRLVTNIGTVFILMAGMWIVVALKRILKNEQENGDLIPVFSLGLSFAGSTVVALINTTLGIFIRRFADFESHSTKTGFFISVTYKLTRAFFMNMVVATFLSNFFTVTIRQFYHPYEVNIDGLINDIFFLFITNSYMSSIFNFFDIVWGYRLWQRYQIKKQGDKCKIPQCEANYIFEGHPVDMALRYANVLKTVFFTAFYGPVVPMGYVFSFIGLIINYWVDKYLLIRRYVCENKISSELPNFVMKFMKVTVILIGIMNMIMSMLPLFKKEKEIARRLEMNGTFAIAFGSFIVGWIYYFVPRSIFFKAFDCFFKMNKMKRLNKEKEYSEVKKGFSEDYSSVHPILKVGEIGKKLKKNQTDMERSLLERTRSQTERMKMTIFETIRKNNDKRSHFKLQS